MNKKILDATATCAFCICLAVAPNIQGKRAREAGAFGSICTGGCGVEDGNLVIHTDGTADDTLTAGANRVFSGYSFTTESDEETGISRNQTVRVTSSGEIFPEAAAEDSVPAGLASPADSVSMDVAAAEPEGAAPELAGGPELLESAPQQFYQNRWGITTLTDEEKELLARILWLEARGEPETGREAVVEVIFNRIASGKYPNTVYDVLSQRNPVQFSSWKDRERATPGEAEYQTIENVLNGNTGILRNDTLYFSRSPLTSRVDARIGAHSFCY